MFNNMTNNKTFVILRERTMEYELYKSIIVNNVKVVEVVAVVLF